MHVDIYGVFLLTGECQPVTARVRRSMTLRVGRAVCRVMARPVRASVTLSAVLREGEICTRCEIRAWSERGAKVVVASIGATLDAALEKSVRRLRNAETTGATSAAVHA